MAPYRAKSKGEKKTQLQGWNGKKRLGQGRAEQSLEGCSKEAGLGLCRLQGAARETGDCSALRSGHGVTPSYQSHPGKHFCVLSIFACIPSLSNVGS